jgi:polysaccharide deacetylase 2 family uncharacterized protein YibQ
VLLTLGIFIGAALWLWLNAADTLRERSQAVPQIKVPVAGGAPPAAEATPAKASEPPSATKSPPPPVAAGPGPDDAFPLAKAPAGGLTEDTRNGLLPIIGADGRQPWQVYARPFSSADKRGRIAIVIGQMGVAGAATGLALQRLPPGVTLAFVPVADRLEGWIDAARNQGHEVILSVPMEPLTYPHDDPGPNTLLLNLDPAHNIDRLEWAMGRFVGYVGVTSPTGSRFQADTPALRPVMDDVKKRGLIYLDAGTAPRSVADTLAIEMGVPHVRVDRIIDQDASRGGIDAQLAALETTALETGAAVGMGEPYPTTLERVAKWVPLLPDKKLILVPLSAIVNLQKPLPPPPEEKH